MAKREGNQNCCRHQEEASAMHHREGEHADTVKEWNARDASGEVDLETCSALDDRNRFRRGFGTNSLHSSPRPLNSDDNGELTNGRSGLSKKSNVCEWYHNRHPSGSFSYRCHPPLSAATPDMEEPAVVGECESSVAARTDVPQQPAHDEEGHAEHQGQTEADMLGGESSQDIPEDPLYRSLGVEKASRRDYSHHVDEDGRGIAGSQEPYGCGVASTSPVSVTLGSPRSGCSPQRTPPAGKKESPKHCSPELTSRQKCKRSKSYERKLHEAMMFSAAVGEKPPLSNEEITREIVEEDSSSDEDDDDANIELQDDASVEASVLKATVGKHDELDEDAIVRMSSVRDGPQSWEVPCGALAPYPMQDARPMAEYKTDSSQQEASNTRSLRGASSLGLPVLRTNSHSFLRCMLDEFETVGSRQQQQDFVYRGIVANPPEVTVRGMSRGNLAQLHRKAWLEVSDVPLHRYGKNLRKYYKHWESLGHPTNMFFDWLDSKGEATGQPLPDLPECPRSELDSDTVLYITEPPDREKYAFQTTLCASEAGSGNVCAKVLLPDGTPVSTGREGWIFVLRDGVLYGAEKVTSINGSVKQRFHHSSFFGGKAVAAAGILVTKEDGCLTRLYPHSGHYRPGEAHTQRMLRFLQDRGVDLSTFEVDTQQIMYISRELKDNCPKGVGTVDPEGHAPKKSKKMQTLHMKSALSVACFLSHKAALLKSGFFSQITQKSGMDPEIPIQDFLDLVDGGGWKNQRALTID